LVKGLNDGPVIGLELLPDTDRLSSKAHSG